MSTRSFSCTRTRAALVSRQANDIARAEIRSFTRSYDQGTIPLMAAEAIAYSERDFSLTIEALPDYGPWAIAYVASDCSMTEGCVVESPSYEAHSFIKVPGIKARKLHVVRYMA